MVFAAVETKKRSQKLTKKLGIDEREIDEIMKLISEPSNQEKELEIGIDLEDFDKGGDGFLLDSSKDPPPEEEVYFIENITDEVKVEGLRIANEFKNEFGSYQKAYHQMNLFLESVSRMIPDPSERISLDFLFARTTLLYLSLK